MVFIRRRLLFWLIKAYLKKWGSTIFLFFLAGLGVFFILLTYGNGIFPKLAPPQEERIGMVGAYTIDSLPVSMTGHLSRGLTKIEEDGSVKPDIARAWKIEDNGKRYVFILHSNIYFSDGTLLDSSSINYSFSDVSISKPNKFTIIFQLKDSYSPFLITVSRPIYKPGYVGVGNYNIKTIKLNGTFVESITLQSIKNQRKRLFFSFYPSEEALKLAFSLGEVDSAVGLSNLSIKDKTFNSYKNIAIEKRVDQTRLVTVFFNTQDPILSDIKLRNGMSYAVPDSFDEGKRNPLPIPTYSWVYTPGLNDRQQNLIHAKKLIKDSSTASNSASLQITMKVLEKYKKSAQDLAKIWKELAIDTKIEVVDTVPDEFQLFLGDFKVPKDPDQYSLWHRNQENNITKFQNIRIDKLLEDGRKVTDNTQRKRLYTDFQKYLLAESPAIFLYLPYEYVVTRK